MSRYILALDQGTSSARAILFDKNGRIVGAHQAAFPQIYPKPGWVEHDAFVLWETQLSVARQAIASSGISHTDIAAIGISNQRETTILWDKATGQPVYPAIVWQDRRTAAAMEQLKAQGLAALFQQKTGLRLDAYFSASKIQWILENVPACRTLLKSNQLAFGTVDSWLIWNLSEGQAHVTDVSNASRTLLFNIHEGDWDDALLAIMRIPRQILPQVVASSGVCAHASAAMFGVPIPIAGVAGDQQAATFGNLCLKPGMVKNTYGTGAFLVMQTGTTALTSQHQLLTSIAWDIQNVRHYCLEGSVFVAGALISWLKNELQLIRQASEIETLAATVPDNGGVYIVPALTGLGAPYWDPEVKGSILGISRGTRRAHIARAALESLAFQVYDVAHAMQQDAPYPMTVLRVDGGAARNDLLLQFQADLLNITVECPDNVELTALGAAFLAGLGVGFWASIASLEALWTCNRRFVPAMQPEVREALLHRWHQAVRATQSFGG